ncbi:MAG: efflux RND transporter periplasmic adaptor subunit [Actinomycetota bacterium]
MQRHVKQSEGDELDGKPSEPFVEPAEEVATPVERPTTRTGKRRASAWLTALVALAAAALLFVDRAPIEKTESTPDKAASTPAKLHEPPPVPVTVGAASTADVPIYLDGLGTVQASNTVAIHTQVDGKLQSVNFAEGQKVNAGDVLAIVDPRPFQAALDQAKAKKAQDEAQLVSDAKDLARFQDLVKKGAGTQQAVDQQQAKVDALKATIAADQAGIENAETQLSYATITAPISGRVGFRQIDAGNIVHANDQTPITMLTSLKPIMVVFTLPQRNLAAVQDAMAKGEVTVIAMDQDNARELGKGKLLLIDNQIDQTTSTIKMKASFPNADERLWPGEFVRVRVLVETLSDAVTIPQGAVQRNSQGLLVWVINTDDTAEDRPIVGGPTVGNMTVVKSGLTAGERVVVSGQYRLRPGARVSFVTPQTEPQGEGVSSLPPQTPPQIEAPEKAAP